MASELSDQVGAALQGGTFDPQHAGEVFLRSDAEKAVRAKLPGARVQVAGKDEVRGTGFLGERFAPDLVIEQGRDKVAVTITLLRGDAAPVTRALAGALVLSGQYDGVVAFVLDRRLAKRNPFDDPKDEPEQRELSDSEKALVRRLRERHGVMLEVRKQDPFGW
jgi:hypothetical protein